MTKRKCRKVIQIFVWFFCTALLTVLTGCAACSYKGYSGNYPDLYTVAINSLLWNGGHSTGADRYCDSEIKVLEKDEFGRILFTYYEKEFGMGTRSIFALIVSQYSEDGYVYYYEDCNYLNAEPEKHITSQQFSQEEIENLKVENDWDKEINLVKCTKKDIIREKRSLPTDKEAIKEAAVLKLNSGAIKENICVFYLTSDNKCNFIAYGTVVNVDYELYFVAFVNSEGEIIDWLIPENLYAYQEELKNFKQKNGWQFK